MAVNVTKVWEATVFVGRTSFVGNTKEVELPTIENTTSDYETLGMLGSLKLANGKEAMELRIAWDGMGVNLSTVAWNLEATQDIMVRSQIEIIGTSGKTLVPVVFNMKGIFRSKEGGTFAAKSDLAHESVIDIFYFKEEIDGVETVEFDPVNNIYAVNGVNLLAERNRNLGL